MLAYLLSNSELQLKTTVTGSKEAFAFPIRNRLPSAVTSHGQVALLRSRISIHPYGSGVATGWLPKSTLSGVRIAVMRSSIASRDRPRGGGGHPPPRVI